MIDKINVITSDKKIGIRGLAIVIQHIIIECQDALQLALPFVADLKPRAKFGTVFLVHGTEILETVASLPGPIRRSLGRNTENRLGTRSMPPSWPPTRRTA